MMMVKLLGEIKEANPENKKIKSMVAEEMLKGKASSALITLSNGKGYVDKLYKGEICSLRFALYGLYMDEERTKKPELVNILCEKIKDNCYALQRMDLDLSLCLINTTTIYYSSSLLQIY
jgi:hypothetical protein